MQAAMWFGDEQVIDALVQKGAVLPDGDLAPTLVQRSKPSA